MRLIVLCICALLSAACGTLRDGAGTSYPWPYPPEGALAPVVIRSATVRSTTAGEYSRGKEALMAGTGALLAGGSVGPLGLVIAFPIAIGSAISAYSSEGYCLPRAQSAMGDLPTWVLSTLGSIPALDYVPGAARRELRGTGGPVVEASTAGDSEESRAAEIAAIGKRLGAENLILADVYVEFGEIVDGCKVKLVARADVRVQRRGQPEMTAPRFSLWAEQGDAPVEDWAAHPDRARTQLTVLLEELGRKLIDAYRDRTGCAERQCGW